MDENFRSAGELATALRAGEVSSGHHARPAATAIPAGRSSEGLPVGVQLIGPTFENRTPLRLAELLEDQIGGFQTPRRG